MVKNVKPHIIIGRAEIISFPEIGVDSVHARIDTGARTSAMWASYAEVEDGQLAVIFFGEGHPLYDGKKHYFSSYSQELVISSNGQGEVRYMVKMLVVLEGRRIRGSFTLANRGTQTYPVLIGRNVLRGKFVVDVKLGKTLAEKERELLEKKKRAINPTNQEGTQ